MTTTHTWSPADYQHNASFVPKLGAPMLAKLAPRAGERILDLGCGDGVLTEDIAASGATVVGIDGSPTMVAAARARGLDARVCDARALPFESEFDAVFSNAVLHWIPEADAVLQGVRRALKPGGRFIAELGGHGNIAALSVAIRAVLTHHEVPFSWPWYYPTTREYASRLIAAGLVPVDLALVPRPTPLPTDMEGWLRTFRGSLFDAVPEERRAALTQEILDLLRPALCDEAGTWIVDYVRLRVVAKKSVDGR
jgi:SAM-dependent methyltransferase